MGLKEKDLHLQVAHYLKWQHPDLIFATDFAAGLFLPPWLAKRQAELRSGRGYPDIFIAKPTEDYHGLFLELKTEGTVIYKKDGTIRASKGNRYAEQAAIHEELNRLGFLAVFAMGYDNTIQIIRDYLEEAKTHEDRPQAQTPF